MNGSGGYEIKQGDKTIKVPMMMSRQGTPQPTSQSEMQHAAVELLNAAKENMQIIGASKAASAFMFTPEGGGGAAGLDAANQQLTNILTSVTNVLTGTLELERKARQAAESAQTDMAAKYFTTIADHAKELQTRVQGIQPTGPRTIQEIVGEFEAFQSIVNSNAARIAKEVISTAQPPVSKSGLSSIDVDFKKLELEQTTRLAEMRQNHEIAMKNLDLQLAKLGLEAAQWRNREEKKNDWWSDFVTAVGGAVKSGVQSGAQSGGQSPPSPIGQTTAGMPIFACQTPGCDQKFSVYPGSKFFSCPTCGTQYKVSEGEAEAPEPQSSEEIPI